MSAPSSTATFREFSNPFFPVRGAAPAMPRGRNHSGTMGKFRHLLTRIDDAVVRSEEVRQRCIEDLAYIRGLEHDWDGAGASPIAESVVQVAGKLIHVLQDSGSDLPDRIVPSPDGSIFFGWVNPDGLHEVEVDGTDLIVVYSPGGPPVEKPLSF